jgi:hypothetical protein
VAVLDKGNYDNRGFPPRPYRDDACAYARATLIPAERLEEPPCNGLELAPTKDWPGSLGELPLAQSVAVRRPPTAPGPARPVRCRGRGSVLRLGRTVALLDPQAFTSRTRSQGSLSDRSLDVEAFGSPGSRTR